MRETQDWNVLEIVVGESTLPLLTVDSYSDSSTLSKATPELGCYNLMTPNISASFCCIFTHSNRLSDSCKTY